MLERVVSVKIVLVVDGLGIGGIERVCVDYAKLLLDLGHKVTIINLNPQQDDMVKELPDKVKIFSLNFSRNISGERYAQLIKKNSGGKFAYPIIYAGLKCLETVKHITWHFRHKEKYDIAIAFSGHFNDLTFVADDFVNAKHKIGWLHGALYGYLLISDGYYNLYKKIKNLICLVDDAQEEALIYNHCTSLNIYKLYNPTFITDRPVDSAKVSNLKEKYGKYILMVSRFEYPHKDQFTVCAALKILRNQYKENVDLVLIGDGPDKGRVMKYATSLGKEVNKHIHFLGTQTDVQNYYASAYILVHASVAGEGLPTVQLEALSYALPQVVTDSKVGPREILGDNEYGMLCRVKDPADMASKLHRLLNDRNLYDIYRKQSSRRIKDFEPETVKLELKRILDDIVTKY